ncbi:LysR family transcriptional regulator [Enterovibrio sp. ZSDZ42]|uniref:LysR family transcriptional regulator n=1 Tax=Enterovibrio gelatinilyticus TaxID=2899819 RepID=A0ABT5R224_9GAMM|nr:LysR family transcriptional regulator [Enterovibrio sp. ZSDZ42]MDD1793915.1 LysR family transcriptional regulator [Enterovibrio sp. ZSDZ42]
MGHNLDIQSMFVLVKMYELRNVKLVADALGKTSSAISKILSKLKVHFEDPLFIQGKHGFEPTTFMDTNLAHFEQILETFDAIQHTEFSPQTLKQEIVLYGHALFWDNFGGRLYLALREEAPLARISMRQWSLEARSRMVEGENTVLFSTYDETLPQVILQKPLCEVSPTFYVRHDHPAQSMDELKHYPFVITRNPGWNDVRYPLLERLAAVGYQITPTVEVENTKAIESIVRNSDHYSFTMSRLIPEDCRGIALPTLSDDKVNCVMSYHRAKQNDPQKEWLYRVCHRVLNQLED